MSQILVTPWPLGPSPPVWKSADPLPALQHLLSEAGLWHGRATWGTGGQCFLPARWNHKPGSWRDLQDLCGCPVAMQKRPQSSVQRISGRRCPCPAPCPLRPACPAGPARIPSLLGGRHSVRSQAREWQLGSNLGSAPSWLGSPLTLSVLICAWGLIIEPVTGVKRRCMESAGSRSTLPIPWPEHLTGVPGWWAPEPLTHLTPASGRPWGAHAAGQGLPCLQLRAQPHSGRLSLEQSVRKGAL